jgi:hypothetical protein
MLVYCCSINDNSKPSGGPQPLLQRETPGAELKFSYIAGVVNLNDR